MKAVRIHSYGGPEVLKYEDAPEPKPGKGEVLIKVYAAGVNPVDWKVREGYLKQAINYPLPLILGWDVAGIVESIGTGVTKFKKGDEIFGKPDLTRNGAYAEYIVVNESDLALKPKSKDFVHSAAVPVTSLTAWQSLFDVAKLEAGQKILIHAAAGGVGSFAVQFAKWKGAYVIGTASKNNLEWLKSIGADETIDYNVVKFEDVVHDMDVVLDTIGGETQNRSWKVLKKGGILVSTVGQPSEKEAEKFGVRCGVGNAVSNPEQLNQIANLIDEGKVNPLVETILPLSEARRAHEISQSGHTRGKSVLKVI
jgi:NADPH:quinone reductase-like Zn-dependent oxidoreductase